MRALQRENVELPGGRIESDTKEYTIKVKGEFPTIRQFNDLIVGHYKGATIRIRDVGRAEDGMEEKRIHGSFQRYNFNKRGHSKAVRDKYCRGCG